MNTIVIILVTLIVMITMITPQVKFVHSRDDHDNNNHDHDNLDNDNHHHNHDHNFQVEETLSKLFTAERRLQEEKAEGEKREASARQVREP